jgi:para-aminobenzoate synthetase / 4-amino-4-deoxychorismate lyase
VPGGLGRYKWADRDPLAPFDGRGRAAVICDADGAVLEASSANVWALIGDRLVTPPADGRILPGVTRSRVLDLGGAGSVRIAEEPFTLAGLDAADGIVVTSAIRVAAAAALGTGRPAARAARLAEELRQALYAVTSSGSGSTPSLRLSPSALK